MWTFETVVERFSLGLEAGLRSWAAQPGALTVARNGGNELALRSQLLGQLEEALESDAFSESEGSRVDATFRAGEMVRAAVEFKHHLLHEQQLRYIAHDDDDATRKVTRRLGRGDYPVAAFVVNFVFALHAHADCRLVERHNSRVTPYKRFQARESLQESFWKASLTLGHPFGEYMLSSPRANSWGELICWADYVSRSGCRTPLREDGRTFSLEK